MKRSPILRVCALQLVSVFIGVLISVFDKKVCLSDECKTLVTYIRESVDNGIEPCDDFYMHACRKIILSNTTGGVSPSAIAKAQSIQFERILKLLMEEVRADEPRSYGIAKRFFNICQDNTTQTSHLKKFFSEVGGFPVLEGDKWKETDWTWLETTRKLRKYGLATSSFFKFTVQINSLNFSQMIPTIDDPVMNALGGLSGMVKECDGMCQLMVLAWFVEASTTLGADKKECMNDAKKVLMLKVALVKSLRKCYPRSKDIEYSLNATMSLRNLSSTYSFINWQEYFKIMLQNDKGISEDDLVLLQCQSYINDLKLIFEVTPKRDLANYMMFQVITENYVMKSRLLPAVGRCFQILLDHMTLAVESMYFMKYGDNSYKQDLEEMVKNMEQEIIHSIENSDWLDSKTKQEALDKAKQMYNLIGYPEKLSNVTFVDETYESLTESDSYFSFIISLNKVSTNKLLQILHKTIKRHSWETMEDFKIPLFMPNAVYSPNDNSIIIIHGILQYPLYHRQWPKYMKYGGVGSIVGHEIMHGFDTLGSKFDKEGMPRNWFTTESLAKFNTKAQCFIDQYSNFTISNGTHDLNLPGKLESGEIIGDSGGLKLAFEAYRRYSQKLFWPELSLPGLQYTQEQLFFLGFAIQRCTKYPPPSTGFYKLFFVDEHPPNNYRVLGSLQNNRYFSEVFGCESNSKMNPDKKCELW